MNPLILLSAVLLGAWSLTWAMRRYALAHGVLDVPNQRSSHVQPTPRGGGISIVISCGLAMPVLAACGWLDGDHLWALLGSGFFIALVGFIDDHRPLAARWRLLAHFAAAAWGLYWLGGVSASILGGYVLPGWLLGLLGLFYLVWLLNLYNFMDGIDGLAGVEAICVCLGGAVFYLLLGRWELALLPAVVAVACCGFLFWNFPPARIFMGDGGSGYLGMVLGLLSLQAAWVDPALFWAWSILLGAFIADATVTLLRRLLRGEPVHQAHRSHAYQFAARHFGRHLPVTLAVAGINLCWLSPLALAVVWGASGPLLLFVAYVPLVMVALKFRAGLAE